jgi:hypothetical protein
MSDVDETLDSLWEYCTADKRLVPMPWRWTQIGSNIVGEAGNDYSGEEVVLSAGGTVLAIGAPLNDDGGNSSGHVRVYENQSGSWVQIGSDIDGEAADDLSFSSWIASDRSIALSSDGSIIAIGAE